MSVWAVVLLILAAFVVSFVLDLLLREPRYVHVTSTGKATSPPDEASITIGLRSENVPQDELPQRQSADAEKSQQIAAEIKRVAPEASVETRTYSVTPDYNRETGEPTGFTIYNSNEVRIKDAAALSKLSEIVRVAVEAGSNSIGGVNYSLQDETRERLALEAQQDAVRVGRAKANSLAQAASQSLGKPLQIVEESIVRYNDFARTTALETDVSTTAPDLRPPEEIDFTSTLQMRYALR